MKYLILVLIMLPGISLSQTPTGDASTKAACSAANTGTITTLTINCYGMSKEQAGDMLRLVNKILNRQIDPKEVYRQLDQIQNSLADIGDVVNPLAKASSTDVELINDSQRLALSCSNFIRNWQIDLTKRRQTELPSAQRPSQRAQPSAPVDWHEIAIEVDQKKAAEFDKNLASRVKAIAGQVIPELPPKWSVPHKVRELENPTVKRIVDYREIVGGLTLIYDQYKDPDIVAKPDSALLASLKSLREECMKFEQDWQAEYNKTAGVGTQTQSVVPSNSLSLKDTFDAKRSSEFEKAVAPQLIAWRTKILARDPSLGSSVDYRDVLSSLDASRVCMDVMNTGNGYRNKMIDDLKKRPTR